LSKVKKVITCKEERTCITGFIKFFHQSLKSVTNRLHSTDKFQIKQN